MVLVVVEDRDKEERDEKGIDGEGNGMRDR